MRTILDIARETGHRDMYVMDIARRLQRYDDVAGFAGAAPGKLEDGWSNMYVYPEFANELMEALAIIKEQKRHGIPVSKTITQLTRH